MSEGRSKSFPFSGEGKEERIRGRISSKKEQALEEKERDDDDEGKWLILILWLGGQENMTFFDQSCLFVDIIRYSWIIVDILLN